MLNAATRNLSVCPPTRRRIDSPEADVGAPLYHKARGRLGSTKAADHMVRAAEEMARSARLAVGEPPMVEWVGRVAASDPQTLR